MVETRGQTAANPQFSADCSRVVFESNAANLTVDPAVPNQYAVYVRDLRTQSTMLASRPSGGGPANSDSTFGVISPDGTSVAFTSWATNLGIGFQGPEAPMIYVEDLASHRLESPSAALAGSGDSTLHGFAWPDYSPDGRYLVFRSITDSKDPSKRGKYAFVWDLVNHQSALTSVDGHPVGWRDACVSGTSSGTSFSPRMSDASSSHGYRVLFHRAGTPGICLQVDLPRARRTRHPGQATADRAGNSGTCPERHRRRAGLGGGGHDTTRLRLQRCALLATRFGRAVPDPGAAR